MANAAVVIPVCDTCGKVCHEGYRVAECLDLRTDDKGRIVDVVRFKKIYCSRHCRDEDILRRGGKIGQERA